MGRKRRHGRPLDGVLLLDKSPGESSNAALQTVKRLFGAQKAGHTGSLDPLASGLLPICFGEATKISAFLLDADKDYWVRARFGSKTATADREGEVTETTDAPMPGEDAIREAAAGFVGPIDQIPPMYSAVKHKGKRLYELARAGEEVERQPRRITIHAFDLLHVDGDCADLRVRCSKGTYVRTLVEDLAQSMGHLAHVDELRRLGVGPFSQQGMIPFDELEKIATDAGHAGLDEKLLPIASALSQWPAVEVDADSSYYLRRGEAVQIPQAPTEGHVRVYDENARFLAVGEVLDDGRVAPRRVIKLARV